MLPLAFRLSDGDFWLVAQAVLRPFGRLAALSVAILTVTGLYSMGRQVASLDALMGSLYGQTLLTKVGLMGLVGLIGLLNSALLHPRGGAPGLRYGGAAQVGQCGCAHSCRGCCWPKRWWAWCCWPPSACSHRCRRRGPAFAPTQPVQNELNEVVDDLVVTLDAKPNHPGQNVLTIHVLNTRRPAPAPIAHVTALLAAPVKAAAPSTVEATAIGPDLYQIGGNQFNQAGPWHIDVVVQRPGFPDSTAHFDWRVFR
ncbi:MAG: CopD family protein [Caldilineaceae bacterium]